MNSQTYYINVQDQAALSKYPFKYFLEDVLTKQPFVLIVTAPWCGHCVHFKPEIAKSMKTLKAKKPVSSTTKKGGNVKKNKVILHLSDDTMQHITQSHSNSVLGKLLSQNVNGFPTTLGASALNRNTMNINHFNKERTAENLSSFIDETHQ